MKKFLLATLVALLSITAYAKDSVKELNDENCEKVLSNPVRPIIIDFSATWCGPCKMFAPVYHEVAEEMALKADFYKVDVDESPVLSGMMQIQAVPTIILMNPKTEKVDVIQGAVDKEEFLKRVKAIL